MKTYRYFLIVAGCLTVFGLVGMDWDSEQAEGQQPAVTRRASLARDGEQESAQMPQGVANAESKKSGLKNEKKLRAELTVANNALKNNPSMDTVRALCSNIIRLMHLSLPKSPDGQRHYRDLKLYVKSLSTNSTDADLAQRASELLEYYESYGVPVSMNAS